uniref:Uncharacterized protein n=1 Tax=Arundo donax TaxID=35708 RepID=A0A0A9DIT6_ARUDO
MYYHVCYRKVGKIVVSSGSGNFLPCFYQKDVPFLCFFGLLIDESQTQNQTGSWASACHQVHNGSLQLQSYILEAVGSKLCCQAASFRSSELIGSKSCQCASLDLDTMILWAR